MSLLWKGDRKNNVREKAKGKKSLKICFFPVVTVFDVLVSPFFDFQ